MSRPKVYEFLEKPRSYQWAQNILGPGHEADIIAHLKKTLSEVPPAKTLLDVGCGPASWLWKVGLNPVGLDFSSRYIEEFQSKGHTGVVGSAESLPFPDQSFDGVWSLGLFHHLSDETAKKAILEMQRVCKVGGYVAIFDAVYPMSIFKSPFAWLIRKLDRGEFVRSQNQFESMLNSRPDWNVRRVSYAKTGLEAVICVRRITSS